MKTETLQIIAEIMRNTREQHTFEALKKAVETEESGARAKTGKINFFKFALKPSRYLSDDRKWMTGIVHKDGKRIASDGFIVVMERADYPEDMEGKSVDKKGAEIERNTPLPEFRCLIPKDTDEFPKIPVKEDFKTDKDSIVKVGDVYVRGDILSKFLDFCIAKGASEFCLCPRTITAGSYDGDWVAAAMQYFPKDVDEEAVVRY